MADFDEVLQGIFEERAAEFSPGLRALLHQLFQEGVLHGRGLERQDHQEMIGSTLSECGRYWCVPVQKEMLVKLEGDTRELEELIRSRPIHPGLEILDRQILEELISKVTPQEPLPCDIVIATSGPRVPARRSAWEDYADTSINLTPTWKKELYGSWSSSAATSTTAPSRSSGTGSNTDDGSGNR